MSSIQKFYFNKKRRHNNLLSGLLELLLQLRQPAFELIEPSEDSNPLVLQVVQLQTTGAARTRRVLVLQEGERRR